MDGSGFMFDTVAFNRIADGELPLDALAGRRVFATHVQFDELGRTGDPARKSKLLQAFAAVMPASLPTDTAVWNDSKWGKAKWSANDGVYARLVKRIKELDSAMGKKYRDPLNPTRDARIAETSIKSNLTLVTNDESLGQATRDLGGAVMTVREFVERGPRQDPDMSEV